MNSAEDHSNRAGFLSPRVSPDLPGLLSRKWKWEIAIVDRRSSIVDRSKAEPRSPRCIVGRGRSEAHRKPRIMITVSRSRRTMSRVLSNITKVASPSAFAKANREERSSRAENRAARAFHAAVNRVTPRFRLLLPFHRCARRRAPRASCAAASQAAQVQPRARIGAVAKDRASRT